MKFDCKSMVAGLALVFVGTPLMAASPVQTAGVVETTLTSVKANPKVVGEMAVDETVPGSCTISASVEISGVKCVITATAATCAEARQMIMAAI